MVISATIFGERIRVSHDNAKACFRVFNATMEKELLRDDRVLVKNIRNNGKFYPNVNCWGLKAKNEDHYRFLKFCFLLAKDFAKLNEDGSIMVGRYQVAFDPKFGLKMREVEIV